MGKDEFFNAFSRNIGYPSEIKSLPYSIHKNEFHMCQKCICKWENYKS